MTIRIVTKLTDNRFLNIKQVVDPSKGVRGYQFAERAGTDSVAFICYDKESREILLNKELKPPVDEFILGAFRGSIDKDKSFEQIVIGEVREEAGFIVGEEDVKFLGKVMVSTQMNQFCHLYVVTIDKKTQREREPENAVEALATTEWVNYLEVGKIARLEDWKPLAILYKAIGLGLLPKQR